MSNVVTFTREVQSDAIWESELVDEVYYNENTGDLYIDLDPGAVYKYSNVPVSVVDAFESAESAGAFYNTEIKRVYGPAEDLGSWTSIEDYDKIPAVKPEVVTVDMSGGYNLPVRSSERFITTPTITTDKTFSLKPFTEDKVEGVEREYRVTFEVDGLLDHKTHTLKSTSVDEAVQTVLDLGKMLDLTFIVREVTIRFE